MTSESKIQDVLPRNRESGAAYLARDKTIRSRPGKGGNAVRALCVAGLLAVVLSAGACKSSKSTESAAQQPASAPATTQGVSVDDLVAPIALYPDQLLAQVLTTAANPQEVLDLGNWLLQNQNLQGDAAINAAKQAGFSPSAQYLAGFPQVVDNMCQQMDWTKQVGEAFKSDQKAVMDAVQRKRAQAQQAGNLNSSPQMTVANQQAENGQQYVEIKPADPKVVYVPQYNPVTIYNTPAPAAPATTTTTTTQTTTEEKKSGVSTGTAVAVGLLSFGVGMAVGAAINNNNDYYPYPSWGYHSVYVVNRPYYPPPYRPPVYPGYRPVYGYNPPGNYHWNQYNRNVNVNVNNNYYNRFNNTRVNTTPANTRLQGNAGSANVGQQSWRGQSTYQGARPKTTQGQKPGSSMANAIPRSQEYGGRATNQRAATANVPRSNAGNLGAGDVAANRTRPTGNVGAANRDSGAGALGANRASPASRPANVSQPASANLNRGGDRGYGANASASRPTPSAPASQNRASASNNRGGAFGGRSASGKSEHTASSRGRSSMGAGGRRAR